MTEFIVKRQGFLTRAIGFGVLCFLFFQGQAPEVFAAKEEAAPVVERESGRVVQKDAATIVVRTPREVLSFDDIASRARMPQSVRVGDEVIIRFTRESGSVKLLSASMVRSKRRGQKAGEKGKPVLDDRAFFSAQRGSLNP